MNHGAARPAAACVAATALLTLLALASLVLGSRTIAPATVLEALRGERGTPDGSAVWDARLPRTVVAGVVGATLAMAGTVMQALSRNPLAEPGLLGVSWGAAAAAVLGQLVLGVSTAAGLVALAVLGAALAGAAVVVLDLLGRGGPGTERLVIAGAAVSGLLAALVQGLLVIDRQSLEVARRWLAGSLTGTGWDALAAAAPVALTGIVLAVVLASRLTALSLGDDIAAGLGVGVGRAKLAAAAAVVALSGASVALAGPIVLVGLAVPHAARRLGGPTVGAQLALSVVLGACFVLAADILARLVIAPEELPVGVVCAGVGAPVLVRLARRRGRG